MTSMWLSFETKKNKREAWHAIELYEFRAFSSLYSVSSVSFYLAIIYSESVYDCFRTIIAFSSSKILPLDSFSTLRIVVSVSLSNLLFSY